MPTGQKACGHNFDDEIEIDDSLTYVFLRRQQPPTSPSPLPQMSSLSSREPSSGDHHSGTSTQSRQYRGRHGGGAGDARSEISAVTISSSSSSSYSDPALQSDFAGSILMQEQRGIRSPATAAPAGVAATYRGIYDNNNGSQGQRNTVGQQHNNDDWGSSRRPSASYFTSSPPPVQIRGPGSRHGGGSTRQEWAPFISSPLARHSETVARQNVLPQSESQSRQHNRPFSSPASVRAQKRSKYHATVEDASDHDRKTSTRVTALSSGSGGDGGDGGGVGSRNRHPLSGKDRALSVFSSAPVRPVPNQSPQGRHEDDAGEWDFVQRAEPGGGRGRSQDRSQSRRSVVPSAAATPAPARPAPARASVARKIAQHHQEQDQDQYQDQQQRQCEFLAVPQIKSILKRVREILREGDALAVQLRGQAVGARSAFVESTRGRVAELHNQLVDAEEAMASIAEGFYGVEELDLAHDDLFGAWFGWADG